MKKRISRKVPFVLEFLFNFLDDFQVNNLDDFPDVKNAFDNLFDSVDKSIRSYYLDVDLDKFEISDYSVLFTFESLDPDD